MISSSSGDATGIAGDCATDTRTGSTRVALPDLLLMAAYGFVSGLPLPLSGFTLRQWMSESHAGLDVIGLTANIGLAYTLKFLWAPFLDSAKPPLGLARFGRRRGWLLAINPALALAAALLALANPAHGLIAAMVAASLLAFLSATQDIAIDAWRIEYFPPHQQGQALAGYVWGYRAALLVATSGAIALATPIGWHLSLLLMAALILVGVPVTLFAPDPQSAPQPPAAHLRFVSRFQASVVQPLRQFMTRPSAGWILAFVMLFKLGEVLAGTMAAPFYHALGFNRAQVAAALSFPNLVASLCGIAFGGWLVSRVGTGRALLATGMVQMATMFLYFALAASHGDVRILYAKVVLEAFAESMADAAFLTFLSGLCTPEAAATQYALLSSLAALGLRTLGGLSGFLAHALGWVWFYGLSIFAALPAMIIMLVLLRRLPGDYIRRSAPG